MTSFLACSCIKGEGEGAEVGAEVGEGAEDGVGVGVGVGVVELKVNEFSFTVPFCQVPVHITIGVAVADVA